MSQVIYKRVFKPHLSIFKLSKNDRAEIKYISCENSANCELYKRGECSLVAIMSSQKCPYGTSRIEEGPTKRSKKYYEWINKKDSLFPEASSSIKDHSKIMAVVGDYIILPYSFITMNKNVPFLAKGGAFLRENSFLKMVDFNLENIIKIVDYKPQALMGGEILDYQEESVPKFVLHLSEKFPALYQDLIKQRPHLEIKKVSNIGRLAVLNTINPSKIKDIHGRVWDWDGESLTCNDPGAVGFGPFKKLVESFVKVKPDPGTSIKIESEEQVSQKTLFLS